MTYYSCLFSKNKWIAVLQNTLGHGPFATGGRLVGHFSSKLNFYFQVVWLLVLIPIHDLSAPALK